MVFAIMGYLYFGLALVFHWLPQVELVIGTVFLAGAFFVFLIARIFQGLFAAKQQSEDSLRESEACCKERLLVSMRDVSKRRRLEERMTRLNECFLGFSDRHQENIERLTRLCGELMGGVCALYNRLDGEELKTVADWNAPDDFARVDRAEGHLCTDVIRRGGEEAFCVRNLSESAYADSDPNVKHYGLQTYVGMPVKCKGAVVGSLCVVFQSDFTADTEDGKFLGILASAVGMEEERKIAEEALQAARAELEMRVQERTAELARVNELLLVDIAQRKKTEEALWKSETILRKVFEAIPDMVSVIDRNLMLVHSNWHGGYEYVSEADRNRPILCHEAYYPGQGKPCENCHSLQVFRTGKPVSGEKYNPHIGLVEARAFPIFDDSGEVVMVAESVRDITEHRRMEEELRKAQKLESLGVLAGGIAHDFNNLLTGILGNVSLARLSAESESDAAKRLDEAEKAVYRARDLTQQLMTFSKGGTPVKKTASIEHIVKDSADFILRGSNVRCEFDSPQEIWPVDVDEGQMNQVINNLIINADQSMEQGGIIEVRFENVALAPQNQMALKEGRYVKISIIDHGHGIPDETIHRIFDPYYTTKEKGNGLGLATVYSIIKHHDGYVGVDSRLNTGSTFYFYLPASRNGLPHAGEDEENPLPGAGKILVMDDEEVIRVVAARMLKHLGYNVETCRDGNEAIDLYRAAMGSNEPFSAVIMDLTIPGGMGGKETIQELIKLDSAVIGIVSSGYSHDAILSSFREYGFSGMVKKPYSLGELGKVLYDLVPAALP
jgi:signal transduction histidine kinase/CheY-like chemotaxis protein